MSAAAITEEKVSTTSLRHGRRQRWNRGMEAVKEIKTTA
jgi:hypothetical protein